MNFIFFPTLINAASETGVSNTVLDRKKLIINNIIIIFSDYPWIMPYPFSGEIVFFTLTIFIIIILIRGETVCKRTHCNFCTIPNVILYKFVTMKLLLSDILCQLLYLYGSDVQNTIKIAEYRTENVAFRSKRSCVCPNPGFKAQLRLWEAMKFKLESSFLRQIFFKSCLRCI